MKYVILFIALFVVSTDGMAQGNPSESFEITDGPTMPNATNNTPVSPIANTPAVTPNASEEGGIEYDIVSSKPPCTNSTCVTPQMIANANHDFVYTSPVKTYLPLLEVAEDEEGCQAPVPTGMTVFRQVVEEGAGKVVEVQDAFCLNKGCVYFGGIGNETCEKI